MSKTKIKAALTALDKAAKAAFKALNEVTDGAFEGSPAEAEPTRHANEISQRLQKQYEYLEAHAKYEGMSEDEIADAKATEMAEALERLQASAAEKLRRWKVPAALVDVHEGDELEDDEFEDDPDADENAGNTDDEDPDGKQEPV